MKVAFPDIDGQHTKIGTIKSKSNGMITLSEGGQYTPDEVRLIK